MMTKLWFRGHFKIKVKYIDLQTRVMLKKISKYDQQKKNYIFAVYDAETMSVGSFQGQAQIG